MKFKYELLVIIILAAIMYFVAGCSPQEGNELYEETWGKMTIKEKAIYDIASSQWEKWSEGGKDSLIYVREGIRQRRIKPSEGAIPFIDIKDIIISVNDSVMTIDKNFSEDSQKLVNGARFENIDPKWYYILLNKTGSSIDQGKEEPKGFVFSDDLLLDCERLEGGDSRVILYVGRKVYYVAVKDEWGDLKPAICSKRNNKIQE